MSTGRDPRAVGGNGGAIINYVCHSMETTIEPLVQLITSGVFERHPELQAGLVESGIGFVPWLLETMDYAYRAHHFWVRPVIPELPSSYFRRNCFATFQEDHVGLADRRAVRHRRQPDVGQRLPAPRGLVAALGGVDRAPDGRARRGGSRAKILGPQRQARLRALMRGAAVVAGVGESTYYFRGKAPETEFQLACIAIRNAVDDAGLQMSDVDGFVSYMDRNEPVRLSAALGTGDLELDGADVRRRRQRRRRRRHARRRRDQRRLRRVRRRLPVARPGPVLAATARPGRMRRSSGAVRLHRAVRDAHAGADDGHADDALHARPRRHPGLAGRGRPGVATPTPSATRGRSATARR